MLVTLLQERMQLIKQYLIFGDLGSLDEGDRMQLEEELYIGKGEISTKSKNMKYVRKII
jgi:hypothetical protein